MTILKLLLEATFCMLRFYKKDMMTLGDLIGTFQDFKLFQATWTQFERSPDIPLLATSASGPIRRKRLGMMKSTECVKGIRERTCVSAYMLLENYLQRYKTQLMIDNSEWFFG